MEQFANIKLSTVCDLYSGNSIKDDEKHLYEDPADAIPYIATKGIDSNYLRANYENGMYVKTNDSSFRHAPAGSTLLCLEGGSAGKKAAYVEREVAFVNKLCCLSPKGYDARYLYYVVQSNDFTESFFSRATGLISGVSVSALKSIHVPKPPTSVQNAIGLYLRRETEQVDNLTTEIKKSVVLLREYRNFIITEAVTRGLDLEVPTKVSKINWIDTAPASWEYTRLGELCSRSIAYGIIKLNDEPATEGVPVFRCSDIHEGHLDTEGLRTVTKDLSDEYSRTILSGGEVLVNVRGTLGGCAIVPKEAAGWNIAREVAMIDLKSSVSSRYIKYFLLSDVFKAHMESNLAGSVYQGLNIELLEKTQLYLPRHEIQEKIANYLDAKTTEIDALIASKERQVELLREYRKSIISEAVTGKFKVPGLE